VQQDTSEKLMT